ncbi:hypothetical protein ACYEXS_35900 [Paenibacillus sp. MAH-36]|uniref:Uncharacterized protein n=1 Tax=Paenibacillus violae TaxID=3077234 RepID=A0ABU3RG91_9BACL|nr:hypothetical protein [Paenibacillus sp. PFR10]MDU0203310.1 hypothetical protein [Paenibacillus sp. PFR10]
MSRASGSVEICRDVYLLARSKNHIRVVFNRQELSEDKRQATIRCEIEA